MDSKAIVKNNNNEYSAKPVFTPLDENDELRTETESIYTSDLGTPCHSDIKYKNINIEEGNPVDQNFKMNIIIPLIERIRENFFIDKNLSSNKWVGEKINIQL